MRLSHTVTCLSLLGLLLSSAPIPEAFAQGSSNRAASGPAGTVSGPNWNAEDTYWREHYASRPYYKKTVTYTTYQPAYQYGVTTYSQYGGRPFEEIAEDELRRGWDDTRGTSRLTWDEAKGAVRDSYTRAYSQAPGMIKTNAPGRKGTNTDDMPTQFR